MISALGFNSIPGSCLLESEFTVVFGNINDMSFLTLLVGRVLHEVSSLVGWHEWDTLSHESSSDVESGVLLVKIFVPVESRSVFAVKHETISVGFVLEGNGVSGSINTGNDFPGGDFGSFGVIGKSSDVGEVVFRVVEGSKFVASSYSDSLKNGFFLGWGVFEMSSGFVVQSLLGEDWTSNASDNSSPLMRFSNLTDFVLLVCKSTSKEITGWSVFPHVVGCFLSWSNSTSWHRLGTESAWESKLLKHVERSADFWASWDSWVNWNFASVFDPLVSLESVPDTFVESEDPAVVMPESLIPSPSNWGESSLGWAPVVPFVVIPSIPDFTFWVPFPDDWWGLCLLAPVANFRMSSILLNELHAFLLGGKNVIVLSINLFFRSVIMLFIGSFDSFIFRLVSFYFNKGRFIDLLHVFTELFHFLRLL